MNPLNRRRRQTMGALAAIPLAMAGCATKGNWIAPPAGLSRAPAPRSGERWRYQRINRYNDEPLGEILAEVMQVEPQVIVRLSDAQGKVWGEEIYASAWQIVQEPLYNETLRFDDPVSLLPEPLAVGQSAAIRTAYQTASQSTKRSWDAHLKAPGWERISVPAGEFDCLRVDRAVRFEPHQLSRFDARRIDTLWYAPAVNRWVRRDWTGFYLDETTLPDKRRSLPVEEREDSVSWVLLEHQAAPVAG